MGAHKRRQLAEGEQGKASSSPLVALSGIRLYLPASRGCEVRASPTGAGAIVATCPRKPGTGQRFVDRPPIDP